MKILIVEDEPMVAEFLAEALAECDYQPRLVVTGASGLTELLTHTYDLAVLDGMLPDIDGLKVLADARAADVRTPILMLTARGSLEDRVRGLDAGADDYLAKPFELQEFLARVRSLLRRSGAEGLKLTAGDLELDPVTHRVTRAGRKVDLSPREYELLEYLMKHKGKVVTRAEIMEHVWDDPDDKTSNVVPVYMNYLRIKLERPGRPRLLHTERGVGYRLADGEGEAGEPQT